MMGKPRSIDEQFVMLRPAAASGLAARLHYCLLACAAIALALSVLFWHPVPLMIAIFLGIVGLAEHRAGPNIVAALHAYDSGKPTLGEVTVCITRWDTDSHYHATVREPGQSAWTYEFIPQGWQPRADDYAARIWRTAASGQPILVTVDDGIMIPRYDPQRVCAGKGWGNRRPGRDLR